MTSRYFLNEQESLPEIEYTDEVTGEARKLPALTFGKATVAANDIMRHMRDVALREIDEEFEGELGPELYALPVAEWPRLAQARYQERLTRDYVCIPAVLAGCMTRLDENELAGLPFRVLSTLYLAAVRLNPNWDLRSEKAEAAAKAEAEQVEAIDEATSQPLTEKRAKKKA